MSVLTLLLAGIDTLRISSQLVQCLACQSLCWNKASHCGLSQCGFENGAPLRPRSRRISKFDVRTQRSEEYHATFLFEVFILVHFDAYVSELGKVPVNHCLSPTTWTSKPLAYISVLRSSWYSSSWRIPFLLDECQGWQPPALGRLRASLGERPRGQFVGAPSSRRVAWRTRPRWKKGLAASPPSPFMWRTCDSRRCTCISGLLQRRRLLTDNRSNESVLTRLSTTKHPLAVITMMLASVLKG